VCSPFPLSLFSRLYREALFSKINAVPTVYETLTAHSDAASGAAARGKSGAATTTSGGGKSDAGGANGAKAQTAGGKANAKKQKVDPVRVRRSFLFSFAAFSIFRFCVSLFTHTLDKAIAISKISIAFPRWLAFPQPRKANDTSSGRTGRRLTTTTIRFFSNDAQADAQGFKKPSPGFIMDPKEDLSALKSAKIEVRLRRSRRFGR
jgi:hypothetical protein